MKGKLKIKDSFIELSPNLDIKNLTIHLKGFKNSQKTGLYYYCGINNPTDPTEFEYYLVYKKINP